MFGFYLGLVELEFFGFMFLLKIFYFLRKIYLKMSFLFLLGGRKFFLYLGLFVKFWEVYLFCEVLFYCVSYFFVILNLQKWVVGIVVEKCFCFFFGRIFIYLWKVFFLIKYNDLLRGGCNRVVVWWFLCGFFLWRG